MKWSESCISFYIEYSKANLKFCRCPSGIQSSINPNYLVLWKIVQCDAYGNRHKLTDVCLAYFRTLSFHSLAAYWSIVSTCFSTIPCSSQPNGRVIFQFTWWVSFEMDCRCWLVQLDLSCLLFSQDSCLFERFLLNSSTLFNVIRYSVPYYCGNGHHYHPGKFE